METRRGYIQRIAWNTRGWRRPSGDVARREKNSFAATTKFAHEEWLFDFDRLIDGYRYGFLQGLNPGKTALTPGTKIDVTLWTIDNQGCRRWVARIADCELLSEKQRRAAGATYRQLGWLADMKRDALEVGAKHNGLWLDCRFRPGDVHFLALAEVKDPAVLAVRRYNLVGHAARPRSAGPVDWSSRRREGKAASTKQRSRKAVAPVDYDPIEAAMQADVAELLRRKYGRDRIRLEEDSVDVKVLHEDGCVLLELKSHRDPHRAIREALGQLLDYSHRARMRKERVLELIVVGRTPATPRAAAFLTHLRRELKLPVRYLAFEQGRLDL